MQIQHVGYRTKALPHSLFRASLGEDFQTCLTRLKTLGFFADYGAAATSDAFDVSRRTLYRWKQCAKPATTAQP